MKEQMKPITLPFIENLKSACNAAKDVAASILFKWTKNLEYYDKPFMQSHECGRNINLLRVILRNMCDAFEEFIAKANEINVFKDLATEHIYFFALMKFNQTLDTLKYFIFKAGNSSYYEKMVLNFFNKYNSYCKFYRSTFYNYLSEEDKKHVDKDSFLKIN